MVSSMEVVMIRVKVTRSAALAAIGCAILAGCESSGLSPREAGTGTYSTYLYSLYDDQSVQPAMDAQAPLRTPLRVGVAQVGEVAPAQAVVERLRREPALFASVQPVPAVLDSTGGRERPDPAEARRRLRLMRQHAQDLGMDYLLLYGGTMDYGSQQTPAGVMDLTIIGAWVVPSKDVKAVGRASASLLDVRSGRVVLSASAEGERKRWVPTMTAEGAQVEVLKGLRDEVVGRLAEEVVGRVRERAGK
jgi:hypothetical protein